MEVFEQGRPGAIKLGSKDYIATGGQGSIYAKGDTAYKIYTDPSTMIPVAKIGELSVITNPKVIHPVKVLLDAKSRPIGYTMRYVTNTAGLCQTFTKAYRDRNHISPDMVLSLVRDFQHTVSDVHSKGILIVDLNEMNFLVDAQYKEVLFIDVDSYQTRSFQATAIMESIRDRHAKTFSRDTDWFSFGVVSFQMFIGIHPYKGKHPSISGFEDRMSQNISVFHKEVSIPRVCYPFSLIPQVYLDWYKAVFEHGKRLPPPDGLQAVVTVTPTITTIKGSSNFNILEIYKFTEAVVQHISQNGLMITLTTKSVYKNGKSIYDVQGKSWIGLTPRSSHIIVASLHSGRHLKLHDATTGVDLPFDISADEIMSYEGRLYIRQGGHVFMIDFSEMGTTTLASSALLVSTVHKNAKLFDGVVVQNLFGKYFVTIFPTTDTAYEIAIKEIQGQIIDAKFDLGVLMVVASHNGKYTRYVIRLSSDYSEYDISTEADITYSGLNFVTLDNGICVHIDENEDVRLFSNKRNNPMVKVIKDVHVGGDSKMFKNGTTALIATGEILSEITMKKTP